MSELDLPLEALRDQINNAIQVVVQIDRYPDGERRVSELAVVESSRREKFRLRNVSRFEADPLGPDRRVTGRVCYAPLPPAIADHVRQADCEIPAVFAQPPDIGSAAVRA